MCSRDVECDALASEPRRIVCIKKLAAFWMPFSRRYIAHHVERGDVDGTGGGLRAPDRSSVAEKKKEKT